MTIPAISAAIERSRQTETRRIKHDARYSVYTAEQIIKEVNAFANNALQAIYCEGAELGESVPPPMPIRGA